MVAKPGKSELITYLLEGICGMYGDRIILVNYPCRRFGVVYLPGVNKRVVVWGGGKEVGGDQRSCGKDKRKQRPS